MEYCEYCGEKWGQGHDLSFHKDDGPLCECGHYEADHHISWFRGGAKLVEECEFWGWNEHGGAEWLEDEEKWIPHCDKFRRAQ